MVLLQRERQWKVRESRVVRSLKQIGCLYYLVAKEELGGKRWEHIFTTLFLSVYQEEPGQYPQGVHQFDCPSAEVLARLRL